MHQGDGMLAKNGNGGTTVRRKAGDIEVGGGMKYPCVSFPCFSLASLSTL